jgi:acetylornithine/succinyldiaminopimelate/putrescine aminotransferase
MLENAREMGRHAKGVIEAIKSPLITEVRGVGLMIGFQLAGDFVDRIQVPAGKSPSIHLVELLHEAGLLTVPSGRHAVRWLPPLNVKREEIDEAGAILASVLRSLPAV